MPHPSWLLCFLLTAVIPAEEAGLPRTNEASAQIAELDRLPVAVSYHEIAGKINSINEAHRKQRQELEDQLDGLGRSPDFLAYARKRAELEKRRESAWDAERRLMIESAKKIYAARHAEIGSRAPAEVPQARALGFDVLSYPRVDGSTSTGPLGVVLACRILGVPYEWRYPNPRGNPWLDPVDVRDRFISGLFGGNPYDDEFVLATLKLVAKPTTSEQERTAPIINSLLAAHSSTHDAYVNLIEGRKDLNLTARLPSASELKLAAEKGVTIRTEAIARDALVFIVHVRNPVRGLTRQQVCDIYDDRTTTWSAVGGGEGEIQAFRRKRDSGSRELFDQLVGEGRPPVDHPRHDDLYSSGMEGPFSQVTQHPRGIGYSIYYYDHFMAASPYTRRLAIDGVEPNAETIASGAYPWVARVHVAYRDGEAADSPAMKLVRWLVSREGQAVVRESGYVPEHPAGTDRP